MTTESTEPLSCKQAARLLGCAISTVSRLAHRGRLPHGKRGCHFYFNRAALLHYARTVGICPRGRRAATGGRQ